MQMLQDPWYNASQQFGSGIGNYLQQATDRSRLQQAFSAAQSLFQPQFDESGQLIQKNPGEQALGLMSALSQAGPGGLQSGAELLPLLMKEYQRQAMLGPQQGGQPNRNMRPQNQRNMMPSPGQRLPDGNLANVAPRVGRGYTTDNGQPQDVAPYNEQNFQDSTGGVTQGQPGDQNEQYLGNTYPEEQQEPSPQFMRYGPEEQELDRQRYLRSAGDPDKVNEFLNQNRQAVENYNKTLQASQQTQLELSKLRRELSQEQDAFVSSQLEKRKWEDPQTQRIAMQNFLMERGKIDQKGRPAKETDRKAWNAAEKATQRYIDARESLQSPEGRSIEGYDRKYNSTQNSARKFLDTVPNSLNKATGEYDLEARGEAEAILMEQGWLEEEAADLTVPTSQNTLRAISSAPSLGNFPSVQLEGKESSREHRNAYQKVATDLLRDGFSPNDSLLVIRRQLHDQKGWDAEDFQNMLDVMKSMGYEESAYQRQENLNKDIKLSLNEIWDFFTGKEGGRSLKRIYQRPKAL